MATAYQLAHRERQRIYFAELAARKLKAIEAQAIAAEYVGDRIVRAQEAFEIVEQELAETTAPRQLDVLGYRLRLLEEEIAVLSSQQAVSKQQSQI